MAARAVRWASARPHGGAGGAVVAPVLVGLVAVAAAALATRHPAEGAAVAGGVVLLVLVAADVRVLPALLAFTIFAEDVSLGHGLRVGRVAGGVALALVGCYLLFRGRRRLRPSWLLGSVLVYGLWLVASFLWAAHTGAALTELGTFLLGLAYLVAFAVLVREPADLQVYAWTLAIGSALAGLVAIAQYASHHGDPTYRAVGLQGDPNYFAIYQVLALPLVLVLLAYDRTRRRRLLLYGVIAIQVLSLVATVSRTGMFAFVFVVLLSFALPRRIFFRDRRQRVLWALALLVLVAGALSWGSGKYLHRIGTAFNTSSSGDRGSGREDLWAAALHGWREHPWFGLGAGNFAPDSLDLLQNTPGVDTTRPYVYPDRPAHNAYLENLTDLGVVGLVLYLALLAAAIRTLLRAYRRARAAGELLLQRYARALLVSFCVFLFGSLLLPTGLAKPLFISIGLALALDVMTRRLGEER